MVQLAPEAPLASWGWGEGLLEFLVWVTRARASLYYPGHLSKPCHQYQDQLAFGQQGLPGFGQLYYFKKKVRVFSLLCH